MDTEALLKAYNAPRNGTGMYFRHRLVPSFLYSEGMREMALAGCYWLIDLLATELPQQFDKREDAYSCVVILVSKDTEAHIRGEFVDDDPNPWVRRVEYTDLPEGEYKFYVAREDDKFVCILLSEY